MKSLSTDDGDVNENSKQATGLDWQNNNSARDHAFCTFLCRHCTTTTWKFLISRFVEDGAQDNDFLFLFPNFDTVLEFNSRKNCQHLTNWTRWNERGKVWNSANSLFKWRFHSRCPRRCLSSLLGTLRNYDGDGNGNINKAIGLLSKTTTLHVHHAFWYISLQSLHNYDVKWPNFKFTWERERQGDKFYHLFQHLGAVPSLQLQPIFPSFK